MNWGFKLTILISLVSLAMLWVLGVYYLQHDRSLNINMKVRLAPWLYSHTQKNPETEVPKPKSPESKVPKPKSPASKVGEMKSPEPKVEKIKSPEPTVEEKKSPEPKVKEMKSPEPNTTSTSNRSRVITILDWSPAFFSRENGLPIDARIGNCLITRNREKLDISDAVVIEVRNIPRLSAMPQHRHQWQRWVYFNIEPPPYAILDYRGCYRMTDFKGKLAFNWSMTYRTDSDVPMLHGWLIEKNEQEKRDTNINSIIQNRPKMVAALMSNCHLITNGRLKYAKELQKYISTDIYGSCGNLQCKGHYTKNTCSKVQQYKFFLAFENSNCRDYISFKMWMQGFGNGAIPIVLGAYKEDYLKQIPPHSVIFVEDFASPKLLANYLTIVARNETAYREYHAWRKHYKVDYDYRFLGRYAWTKLCETLTRRYDESAKWYDVITDFESVEGNCFENDWVKTQGSM